MPEWITKMPAFRRTAVTRIDKWYLHSIKTRIFSCKRKETTRNIIKTESSGCRRCIFVYSAKIIRRTLSRRKCQRKTFVRSKISYQRMSENKEWLSTLTPLTSAAILTNDNARLDVTLLNEIFKHKKPNETGIVKNRISHLHARNSNYTCLSNYIHFIQYLQLIICLSFSI